MIDIKAPTVTDETMWEELIEIRFSQGCAHYPTWFIQKGESNPF